MRAFFKGSAIYLHLVDFSKKFAGGVLLASGLIDSEHSTYHLKASFISSQSGPAQMLSRDYIVWMFGLLK